MTGSKPDEKLDILKKILADKREHQSGEYYNNGEICPRCNSKDTFVTVSAKEDMIKYSPIKIIDSKWT